MFAIDSRRMTEVDFDAKAHTTSPMGSTGLNPTLVPNDKSPKLVYPQGPYVNYSLENLTLQSKSITIIISESSNCGL